MTEQGKGGSILLVASISGHICNFPQPQAPYNASKAAILHLSRSLAAEWARHGIRINTISPGYMETTMTEGPEVESCRKIWTERNPMGRIGDPEELMGAVVLLCSKFGGRYMTGTDIVVDGELLLLSSGRVRAFNEAIIGGQTVL
jgi:sorbose reductase